MPTYGNAKIKDVAESLLPAVRNKARTAARDRKVIHRNARRASRQGLVDWENETWDDRTRRIRIDRAKRERRQGDKLGTIYRWSAKVTREIEDPVESYLFVKNLLPDNLTGRHALGHVADVEGFEEPGYNEFRYGWRNRSYVRPPEVDYEAIFRDVITSGRHKEFNGYVKVRTGSICKFEQSPYRRSVSVVVPGPHTESQVCNCKTNLLNGLHDVERFARAERLGLSRHEGPVYAWLTNHNYLIGGS